MEKKDYTSRFSKNEINILLIGHCKYAPEQSAVIWSIKSFPGGKEYLMRAHFGLPSVTAEDTEGKPPIQVKFEIPYFTTSGIQVLFEINIY